MGTITHHGPDAARDAWHRVVFDVERARLALPYVSRVVRDASNAYHQVQRTRSALARGERTLDTAQLARQRDEALARLSAAADECNAVGADLLDISRGLVRFDAVVNGRPVSLLWRLGDPVDSAWEDLIEMEQRFPADVPGA